MSAAPASVAPGISGVRPAPPAAPAPVATPQPRLTPQAEAFNRLLATANLPPTHQGPLPMTESDAALIAANTQVVLTSLGPVATRRALIAVMRRLTGTLPPWPPAPPASAAGASAEGQSTPSKDARSNVASTAKLSPAAPAAPVPSDVTGSYGGAASGTVHATLRTLRSLLKIYATVQDLVSVGANLKRAAPSLGRQLPNAVRGAAPVPPPQDEVAFLVALSEHLDRVAEAALDAGLGGSRGNADGAAASAARELYFLLLQHAAEAWRVLQCLVVPMSCRGGGDTQPGSSLGELLRVAARRDAPTAALRTSRVDAEQAAPAVSALARRLVEGGWRIAARSVDALLLWLPLALPALFHAVAPLEGGTVYVDDFICKTLVSGASFTALVSTGPIAACAMRSAAVIVAPLSVTSVDDVAACSNPAAVVDTLPWVALTLMRSLVAMCPVAHAQRLATRLTRVAADCAALPLFLMPVHAALALRAGRAQLQLDDSTRQLLNAAVRMAEVGSRRPLVLPVSAPVDVAACDKSHRRVAALIVAAIAAPLAEADWAASENMRRAAGAHAPSDVARHVRAAAASCYRDADAAAPAPTSFAESRLFTALCEIAATQALSPQQHMVLACGLPASGATALVAPAGPGQAGLLFALNAAYDADREAPAAASADIAGAILDTATTASALAECRPLEATAMHKTFVRAADTLMAAAGNPEARWVAASSGAALHKSIQRALSIALWGMPSASDSRGTAFTALQEAPLPAAAAASALGALVSTLPLAALVAGSRDDVAIAHRRALMRVAPRDPRLRAPLRSETAAMALHATAVMGNLAATAASDPAAAEALLERGAADLEAFKAAAAAPISVAGLEAHWNSARQLGRATALWFVTSERAAARLDDATFRAKWAPFALAVSRTAGATAARAATATQPTTGPTNGPLVATAGIIRANLATHAAATLLLSRRATPEQATEALDLLMRPLAALTQPAAPPVSGFPPASWAAGAARMLPASVGAAAGTEGAVSCARTALERLGALCHGGVAAAGCAPGAKAPVLLLNSLIDCLGSGDGDVAVTVCTLLDGVVPSSVVARTKAAVPPPAAVPQQQQPQQQRPPLGQQPPQQVSTVTAFPSGASPNIASISAALDNLAARAALAIERNPSHAARAELATWLLAAVPRWRGDCERIARAGLAKL